MPALPNANLYPAANVLPPAQKGPGSAATSFDAHHTSPNPSPVAIAAHHSPCPSKLSKATDSVSELSKATDSVSLPDSQGSDNKSFDSSVEDAGWTLVSPRRRVRGPRVPPPYFRMPSHLWPTEIQNKYLHTPPPTESESPISSRTRAKTLTTSGAHSIS
jgi:hypothetical protein